jgi:hypothetical protein
MTQDATALWTRKPALRREDSIVPRKCGCDGGGWIVALDRDRYRSPGEPAMLRYTRCHCFDDSLADVRSDVAAGC